MQKENNFVLWAIGIVSAFIIVQGTIYFFYKITPITIGATIALIAGALLFYNRRGLKNLHLPRPPFPKIACNWHLALGAIFVLFDLLLLCLFLRARTTDSLASPWQILPPAIILLFALTTLMLFWLSQIVTSCAFSYLLALHLLVAYGISEIVYAYGFGFDPFIHRATEEHIAQNGFILPKKPFYNGQYVLVVALHWITRLSVDVIDRALVPFFTAITLPWIMKLSLERYWLRSSPNIALWSAGILFFPMMPLTFTTPSNLSIIFLIYTILLLPLVAGEKKYQPLFLSILAAGLVTHPLIGMAGVCLAVSFFICARIKHPVLSAATAILASVIPIPVLMVLNNFLNHGRPFIIENFFSHWEMFVGLFTSPYAPFMGETVNSWDFLYGYHAILPFPLLSLATWGAFATWKNKKHLIVAYGASALGLTLAAGALAMGVFIPDVISFEQSEFALRLIFSVGLILMPLALIGVSDLTREIFAARLPAIKAAVLVFLAASASVSVYLSYPQWNEKVRFSGWGVGKTHFAAAKLIHDEAGSDPYIVLSDQMLSVAALRLYGFRNLPYAIPTGGELYQYFIVMTGYLTDRQTMDEAMRFAGVERSFFAVSDYYPGYDEFKRMIEPFAEASWELDGKMAIFEFNAKK